MTRFLRPAVALPALLGAVLLAALLTVGECLTSTNGTLLDTEREVQRASAPDEVK